MQAIKLDLNKSVEGSACDIGVNVQFSFRPFIDHVVKKIEAEKTAKVIFYQYILNKFRASPELWEPIDPQQLHRYGHLFELIYSALSPLLRNGEKQLWAIGTPLRPCFYSGTEAFYDILLDERTNEAKTELKLPTSTQLSKGVLTSFYNLVLERFYNFSFTAAHYTVRSILDQRTGLLKHYRLNLDTRFMEVSYDGELPELALQHITDKIYNRVNSLEILVELLPPEKFHVKGISVVNLVDVTSDYALENIKNIIIKHEECQTGSYNEGIAIALKTLVGCAGVQFGLLPYIQLNGKVMMNNQSGFESIIAKLAGQDVENRVSYQTLIDNYLKEPRRLLFPAIGEEHYSRYPALRLLFEQGITAYALFPLYFNGKIVGCLEVYARDPEMFKSYTLSKLEAAFPLLSQLLQNLIVDFNNELTNVVTEQFTAIQPAVRWRFYQAAYEHILSGDGKNKLPIDAILFEQVYPFYGAIDIKDSSIIRNQAMRADLNIHFEVLEILVQGIRAILRDQQAEDIAEAIPLWNRERLDMLSDREILKTEDYLMRLLPSQLKELVHLRPEISEVVEQYMQSTKNRDLIYRNSLAYEESMQKINQVANERLEKFNHDIQGIYPCYFEKFRTDGVEYDIYTGQSIAPDRVVPENLLGILRFKQLELMTEIARATHLASSDLAIHMETTQLIFVYEKLIDISFRRDEQRFDVEGSYNIRYQMVKKRIDKATVKDTFQRLTQPGKITIVYFNSWEAEEYGAYINQLIKRNILEDNLEFLEVEELQGVQGLKALRVGVVLQMNN